MRKRTAAAQDEMLLAMRSQPSIFESNPLPSENGGIGNDSLLSPNFGTAQAIVANTTDVPSVTSGRLTLVGMDCEGVPKDSGPFVFAELAANAAGDRWAIVDAMAYFYGECDVYELGALAMGCTRKRAENIYAIAQKWSKEDRIPGVPWSYYEQAYHAEVKPQERIELIMQAVDPASEAEELPRMQKPASWCRGMVTQILKEKGIPTGRRVTSRQMNGDSDGPELHDRIDSQAKTIATQDAKIAALEAQRPVEPPDKLRQYIAGHFPALAATSASTTDLAIIIIDRYLELLAVHLPDGVVYLTE